MASACSFLLPSFRFLFLLIETLARFTQRETPIKRYVEDALQRED